MVRFGAKKVETSPPFLFYKCMWLAKYIIQPRRRAQFHQYKNRYPRNTVLNNFIFLITSTPIYSTNKNFQLKQGVIALQALRLNHNQQLYH
jgi:hypothetical protein